jgi:large subunit ribosomal protein L9
VKVILLQDVKNLGPKDSVIEVAEGYARNYLIPRGLAVAATEGNLRSLAQLRHSQKSRTDRQLTEAKRSGAKLNGARVTVLARAGEQGRLFGSVTNKDVAEGIASQLGLTVDKKKISLQDSIRNLGEHVVEVKLHPQVTVKLIVEVKPEGR